LFKQNKKREGVGEKESKERGFRNEIHAKEERSPKQSDQWIKRGIKKFLKGTKNCPRKKEKRG